MKHLFLLNGPPGCGKDTVAEIIAGMLKIDRVVCAQMKFAAPVKRIAEQVVCEVLGEPVVWSEGLDCRKDEPFVGMRSPREVAIAVSEVLMKPLFGSGIFGRMAAKDLLSVQDLYDVVVFSDCGFLEEAQDLLASLDPTVWQAHLWHIYRPNTTFVGDSRGWITKIGEILPRSILNVSTRDDLKIEVIRALQEDLA